LVNAEDSAFDILSRANSTDKNRGVIARAGAVTKRGEAAQRSVIDVENFNNSAKSAEGVRLYPCPYR